MPDELMAKYGYAQLTDQIKDQIFGQNAAKLFGIDIKAKREAIKADALGDGLRANRMALVGVRVAGALLLASAAALITGAVRGGGRVQARGTGLAVRF